MWSQIRLLLQEQSDQGLHCLIKRFLKHFSRSQKQTDFVVIGAIIRVLIYLYSIMLCKIVG